MNKQLADIIKEILFLPEEREVEDHDGPGNMEEWDSLGHVNIIGAVEDTFGISISPDEVLKIGSASDIEKILLEKNAINL